MCKGHVLVACAIALLAVPASAGDALRDPMRPHRAMASAPRASAGVPAFRVSAIFVSDARRVAVLNGRTVTVGDRIGGATVTGIDSDAVRLAVGGKTLRAKLNTARIRE